MMKRKHKYAPRAYVMVEKAIKETGSTDLNLIVEHLRKNNQHYRGKTWYAALEGCRVVTTNDVLKLIEAVKMGENKTP